MQYKTLCIGIKLSIIIIPDMHGMAIPDNSKIVDRSLVPICEIDRIQEIIRNENTINATTIIIKVFT